MTVCHLCEKQLPYYATTAANLKINVNSTTLSNTVQWTGWTSLAFLKAFNKAYIQFISFRSGLLNSQVCNFSISLKNE